MMNPKNNVPTRLGYDRVKQAEALDAYTVVVRLTKPFSPIVAYFDAPQAPTAILPAHLLERYSDLNHIPFNVLPIGSGPFRVVEWRHGDHVTLVANPIYWRGRPKIDEIIYKVIPDHNTQVEQLRTHEVDAYFGVDPQLLPEVSAINGLTLKLTPIPDFHDLHFNLRDSVVSDIRVRRAIVHAIDRRRLVEAATHGAGIPTDSDQPLLSWAFDSKLPHISYDPTLARRLLDAAGWRVGAGGIRSMNGKRLTLQLAISPAGVGGSRLVAAVIQEDLHAVGIEVTIKEYAPGLMWATVQGGGVLASGRYQMAYDAWWVLGPDPDDSWNFGCDQIPPAGGNVYFWCNRRADAAMRDGLRTFDLAQRKRDYFIVQRELVRDLPLLPLWQVKRPDAYTPRLHGLSPSPAGSTFWNAWAWSL
jgi:peptide/nickel transport system substrate-binding protein